MEKTPADWVFQDTPDHNGDGQRVARPRSFLGTGWAFPLRTNGRGGIAVVSDEEAIDRSIRIILTTSPGERRMRPLFGCGIRAVVFAPANPTTFGIVRQHVLDALTRWEPRITVTEVDVNPSRDDPALLLVSINYRIKATNDERNLVYPFYLIPGED